MWSYLRRHEDFVRGALGEAHEPGFWHQLAEFHSKQLAFMQHERLVHLLVFLSVCVMFLVTLGYVTWQPSWWGFGLLGLFLVLVAAYVVHYFRLENGVQRWYHLANSIDRRRGVVSSNYDGEPDLGQAAPPPPRVSGG